jgi:hypothetical protein
MAGEKLDTTRTGATCVHDVTGLKAGHAQQRARHRELVLMG